LTDKLTDKQTDRQTDGHLGPGQWAALGVMEGWCMERRREGEEEGR